MSKTIEMKGKPFDSRVFTHKKDAYEVIDKLRKAYHGHIRLRVVRKKDGYQIYQFAYKVVEE